MWSYGSLLHQFPRPWRHTYYWFCSKSQNRLSSIISNLHMWKIWLRNEKGEANRWIAPGAVPSFLPGFIKTQTCHQAETKTDKSRARNGTLRFLWCIIWHTSRAFCVRNEENLFQRRPWWLICRWSLWGESVASRGGNEATLLAGKERLQTAWWAPEGLFLFSSAADSQICFLNLL